MIITRLLFLNINNKKEKPILAQNDHRRKKKKKKPKEGVKVYFDKML